MLLCDRDILARVDAGDIGLDPFDPVLVQPSSVDVRLDRYFRLFDNHRYPAIDPAEEQPELTRLVEVDAAEAFVLHPGEFVLASTLEVVTLASDLAARVEGKSSLGRLGLLTHATAGFVDPGFSGHVTLELSNVATLPIKLWPGMKIGQLCFQLSLRQHPTGRHPGLALPGRAYGVPKLGELHQESSDAWAARVASGGAGHGYRGAVGTPGRVPFGAVGDLHTPSRARAHIERARSWASEGVTCRLR